MAELADAQDLGSCGREAVGVQIPPSAPYLSGIRVRARISAFYAGVWSIAMRQRWTGLYRKAQTDQIPPSSPFFRLPFPVSAIAMLLVTPCTQLAHFLEGQAPPTLPSAPPTVQSQSRTSGPPAAAVSAMWTWRPGIGVAGSATAARSVRAPGFWPLQASSFPQQFPSTRSLVSIG